MSLIKWDPFREFNTLPARLAFWGKDWEEPLSTTTYVPSVDIFEPGSMPCITGNW